MRCESEKLRKSEAVAKREYELMRRQRDDIAHKYSGGLTEPDVRKLSERNERLSAERDGLRRERKRYMDMADHASDQAKAVLAMRDSHQEESPRCERA